VDLDQASDLFEEAAIVFDQAWVSGDEIEQERFAVLVARAMILEFVLEMGGDGHVGGAAEQDVTEKLGREARGCELAVSVSARSRYRIQLQHGLARNDRARICPR
jgi:hypothetical protein